MTITIENTNQTLLLKGDRGEVPARIWEGHTDSGIAVVCFVTGIAVNKREDSAAFERELQETRPLRPQTVDEMFPHGIPLRLVL